MKEILNKYKDVSLESEDGDELLLELRDKTSSKAIKDFEKGEDVQLPDQLKELYLISDGLDLFGYEIPSLDELFYEPAYKGFQFHNWGNGDFDYITMDGSIAFLDNESEELIPVAPSLKHWIEMAIEEIKKEGTLLHPDDFLNRKQKQGLYFPAHIARVSKTKTGKRKKKTSVEKVVVTKVPENIKKVKMKLTEKIFCDMEDRIAKNNAAIVLRGPDDFDFLAKFTKKEIDESIYSLEFLSTFLSQNEQLLDKFTKAFWKGDKNKEVGTGFTFLYAIYLCYINGNNDTEFLEFLKKRSIPKVENFQKLLKQIYAEITSVKK
jgi:hypothetical protein